MGRTSSDVKVKKWKTRVEMANKAYDKWADEFRCDDLEDYYEGFQWQDDGDHYTINLFFPTVEVRLPSLMYNRPKARITLTPYRADDPMTGLEARAQLYESVADHFVTRQNTDFRPETLLATKESLFRFGVVETNYAATFTDNPNAGKPVLNENNEPIKGEDGQVVTYPEKDIEGERLFVRRIPARTFRVPANNKNRLEHNDWCGYYEWHWPSDLRKNPNYKNVGKLKGRGFLPTDDFQHTLQKNDEKFRDGMVKIWKIWDLRAKKRYVFPDDADYFLLEGEPFKYLPFSVLKFHERLDSFYPIPYLFNLLSPQDELNETREMQRIHRRRFARRYMMRENAIDQTEVDKLMGPPIDGQVVVVKGSLADVFAPIPDAPLDRSVAYNIPQTHDDFARISAVGGEARGLSEADTATQATIIAQNSNIRDSFTREHVGQWLSSIIGNILKSARDNLSNEFYIRINVDPLSPNAPKDREAIDYVLQTVKAGDLGDIEFEVTINVETLAPPNKELDRKNWLEAMAVIFQNPMGTMILANSPYLLRRTLDHYDISNGKDIAEIHRAVQGVAMHLMQAQGGNPGNAAANGVNTGSGMDAAPPGMQITNKMTGGMNSQR